MAEIAARKPLLRSHHEIDPVCRSPRTLREHYRKKSSRYLIEDARYDRALRRLFTPVADGRHNSAATWLRAIGPQIERALVRTGLHPYIVEHAMELLIHRCSNMHMQLRHDRRSAQREFVALVRRVALGILKRNRESYAL